MMAQTRIGGRQRRTSERVKPSQKHPPMQRLRSPRDRDGYLDLTFIATSPPAPRALLQCRQLPLAHASALPVRAYVWTQWKLPRTRVSNLMERGTARGWAVAVDNHRSMRLLGTRIKPSVTMSLIATRSPYTVSRCAGIASARTPTGSGSMVAGMYAFRTVMWIPGTMPLSSRPRIPTLPAKRRIPLARIIGACHPRSLSEKLHGSD